MTSPVKVARFHAEYDRHPDDRVRLFGALASVVPHTGRVLYAGSYVDIGPSVWFDDVTYVDVDKRAARWFGERAQVAALIESKRASFSVDRPTPPAFRFLHRDYSEDLPIEPESIDLLVSLYAGFISEHCSRYLKPGGLLLVNASHGDADMANLDPGNELVAVLTSSDGSYRLDTSGLEKYLVPKRGTPATIAELHATNRGIGHTVQAFAYLFTHRG